jgi:hypothetical protein
MVVEYDSAPFVATVPDLLALCRFRKVQHGDAEHPEPLHVVEFEVREPQDATTGCIRQWVCCLGVSLDRQAQFEHRHFIDTEDNLLRRRGVQDLVEERLQRRVRHVFEAERRLAHLADAGAQCGGMLCTQIGVVRERRLQLVDRLRRDAGGQDLVQTLEGVVEALQPADALLDAQPRFRRLFERAKSGERGQGFVRHVAGERGGSWHACASVGVVIL